MDLCTETLRTKLEPVNFGSGIETQFVLSGEEKVDHYENECNVRNGSFHEMRTFTSKVESLIKV